MDARHLLHLGRARGAGRGRRGRDSPTASGARSTWGGEVAASISPEDTAFFNDTGYESSPLRRVSLTLSASLALGRPAALLVEGRMDNLETPRLYALYFRLKPWTARAFDLQVGLIPPVFGAFGRRAYGSGNPLIGFPLAYQYLTTLRTDAVPASADDLLRVRGFGWLVRYPVGNPYPAPGLPVMDGQRLDVGAEVRIGGEPFQLAIAVTQGSLSHPRVEDDNDGKQLSGRLQAKPATGLVLGLSVAAGQYLSRDLDYALPADQAGREEQQRAAGLDLEYSRGHVVVRAEAIWSAWALPEIDPPRIEDPVAALGLSLEAVYRLAPGLDLAARFDRLTFADLQGTTERDTWDAPVTRVEAGVGYALTARAAGEGGLPVQLAKCGPHRTSGVPRGPGGMAVLTSLRRTGFGARAPASRFSCFSRSSRGWQRREP